MNYSDCPDCNGTGRDPSAWDDLCPFCRGLGQVEDDNERYDRDDDGGAFDHEIGDGDYDL